MKGLTSIFQWVVFSNIWISCGVVATTYVGMKMGIVPFDFLYCLIAGFATLFAYNIQRIFKLQEVISIPSQRHIWIEKNKQIILALSVFGAIAGIVLSFFTFRLSAVFSSIPFIILVLLYAYSIGKFKTLRELPFAKIIIISAVWTWTIAVLPMINQAETLQLENWCYIIFMFFFVFALCIPFDIRDIENDRSKIKTLPVVFGKSAAVLIALFILSICLYVAFYFNWIELEVIVVLSSIIILLSNKERKELFYTGLIDGMFLLLWVLYKVLAVFS